MGGARETSRNSPRLGLLVAVGLALLFAGCLGFSDDGEEVDTTETDAAPAAQDPGDLDESIGNATGLSFAGPSAIFTVAENGSFMAHEGAFVGGAFTGADTRSHDLTESVPSGAPVTLNVTITYEGEYSQLNGELVLEEVEVFEDHYYKDFDTNSIYMEATLARTGSGGSVVALVQADLTGASAERSYSLEATIRSHGDAVVPRVPVSIPVTEDSGGFEIEPTSPSGSLPMMMLWGPEDYLGRLGGGTGALSVDLGPADPTGRFVALVPPTREPGGPAPTFEVVPVNASQAPSDDLQVVGLEETIGEWHTVDPESSATWSFNRSTAPARAGLVIRPSGTFGLGADPTGFLEGTLASPSGPVVDESQPGIGFYGGQARAEWLSGIGQENLDAGTYEATVSAGPGTTWEATHVLHTLER